MRNKELPFIKDMFDDIAPRYDLLNRLLSLRQDVYWRRLMVAKASVPEQGRWLDAACGTGDVMLEIFQQKGTAADIVGLDFSPEMLVIAREKIRSGVGPDTMHLLAGNALDLPFPAETFDAVTIAFGIRNITDKATALSAFYDCLKPGGTLCVLELTTPRTPWLLKLYLLYFKKVLPLIGWIVSGNRSAYRYLPQSVVHFPTDEAFGALMRKAGFNQVRWRKLTLGIATLFVGEKR